MNPRISRIYHEWHGSLIANFKLRVLIILNEKYNTVIQKFVVSERPEKLRRKIFFLASFEGDQTNFYPALIF